LTEFGRAFLHEPALFPRRISGEVWGSVTVALDLAGETYRVEGLSEQQAASLATRYGPRLTRGDGTAAATFQMFRAPLSDFREIDTRGWEYWLDLQWGETSVSMAGMRFMARADLATARAGVWTSVDDHEFWGVLENVLRPVLAARLLAQGGLLLHSAAIDGFIFASPSGGGKSTISRMALDAGRPVLSDDLNALVPAEAGFTIVPLPFTGDLHEEHLSTTPQSLVAIVGLEKGQSELTRNMTLADAVSLLMRCSPYVNQDPHRTSVLVERAAEISSSVPRSVLTFRPGASVWPILETLR
jgi:hypothetical protein